MSHVLTVTGHGHGDNPMAKMGTRCPAIGPHVGAAGRGRGGPQAREDATVVPGPLGKEGGSAGPVFLNM